MVLYWLFLKSQGVIMTRWQRAFLKTDAAFKELFGVKKALFLNMHTILTDAYHARHRQGGRKAKLTLSDQRLSRIIGVARKQPDSV
jgi:hypothetical protein